MTMNEQNEERDFVQLHVNIDSKLYKALKLVLPEHGMVSIVVRRLLKAFAVNAMENKGLTEEELVNQIKEI